MLGWTLLSVPKSRLKSKGDRAFAIRALLLWNALPEEIKLVDSVSSFKSLLKTHFYRLAFMWCHPLIVLFLAFIVLSVFVYLFICSFISVLLAFIFFFYFLFYILVFTYSLVYHLCLCFIGSLSELFLNFVLLLFCLSGFLLLYCIALSVKALCKRCYITKVISLSILLL
ncbi:hypothetical protein LDENG_00174150 [Lucifuga dentata]|nr:hypothetical protein LDENG_00174150 [Lucifuga dentata]